MPQPETSPSPRVHFNHASPILPVTNLQASLDYYTRALGFKVNFDHRGAFAGLSRGGATIYLAQGDQGHPGTWVWVGIGDADRLYAEYTASGAKIRIPPTNYPWAYEFHVEDPDGNVLRLGSDPRSDLPAGGWLDQTGRLWPPTDRPDQV